MTTRGVSLFSDDDAPVQRGPALKRGQPGPCWRRDGVCWTTDGADGRRFRVDPATGRVTTTGGKEE